MINFIQLLSSILDNHPNRLLILPSENKIISSFGISKKIHLSKSSNYKEFQKKVQKELIDNKLAFGTLSFDLFNQKPDSTWKDFPIAEFTFPKYTIKFENGRFTEFGKNDGLLNKIIKNSTVTDLNYCRKITKKFNTNHSDWSRLVEKAKLDIKNSNLEKIVVAQSQQYKVEGMNIKNTILNITKKYPDCTTFLYKKNKEYFFGSTPERVFEYKENKLKTDALASSIPNDGQSIKEIEKKFNNSTLLKEHKIVVDFLEAQLSKISNEKIYKSDLRIKSLSNINHLLLELETKVPKNNFFDFINLLHPSPALAGYPVKEAINWIRSNENFDRGLYTGSIGYIEKDSSYFYAALRCAKFSEQSKEISTFAGNGIVENSKLKYEIDELNSKFEVINNSIVKR